MAVSIEWHCVDTEYKTEYSPPEDLIKIVDTSIDQDDSTYGGGSYTVIIDYTRSL